MIKLTSGKMYYLSKNKKGTRQKKVRTSEGISLNEKHSKSENPTEKEANDFGQNKLNAYTLHWKCNSFPMSNSVCANYNFKKHFILKYFSNHSELHKQCREKPHESFTWFSQVVASYIITVKYQNQDN